MGNTGRLCRDVLFKKTRGVVNRCPDSSKQSESLLTPCTALESATALLPYTLLGISHTPVQEAALAAGARISGLEIDHHSLKPFESTTGYAFTPCVGSFTSPGTGTRQKGPTAFTSERHGQSRVNSIDHPVL